MGLFIFALLILALAVLIFFFGTFFQIKGKISRLIGLISLICGLLLITISMITVIDAGEVGVVVIFGKVDNRILQNGINLVPPYAQIYKYSTRITEFSQTENNLIEARVSNGLIIKLDCTALYAINPEKVIEIYSKIAKSLEELQSKILITNLRTVMRNVISKYTSEEVYSSKREQVTLEVENTLKEFVSPKGIEIDKFLIRSIKLPEDVDKAIQLKISAQQEAEAMTYRKQKAEQEAEIKVIEAQGLAKAQQIINSTLTPNYLQHEAIQAYKDLANSPNTTFVIMPTSPNSAGMPLILNAPK